MMMRAAFSILIQELLWLPALLIRPDAAMKRLALCLCGFLTVATGFTEASLHAQQPLRVTREIRIGALEGDNALTHMPMIVVADDGRMFVPQPQENVVRVFDRNGRRLHDLGRFGSGPGEFRSVHPVTLAGDSIWVADSRLGRLTKLHVDGTLLETVTWPGQSGPSGGIIIPARRLADGSFSAITVTEGANAAALPTSRPIPRYDVQGKIVGTIAILGYAPAMLDVGGSRVQSPVADGPLTSFSPDGRRLVIVDRRSAAPRTSGRFQLTWVTIRGDTVARVTVPYDPVALTAAMAERMLASYVGAGMPRDQVSRLGGELRRFSSLPPVTAVIYGRDDAVWVQRESPSPGSNAPWERIEPSGRRSIISLPAPGRIVAASRTHIWVAERGEYDVPYLARYRIE
jgi:hypothetical protein